MGDLNDPTRNTHLHTGTGEGTAVTGTTVGPKHRLDVDASITGEVTISSSVPRWDWSSTSTGLTNGADTTVLSITGTGFIDFIQVVCSKSTFESIITIDGSEELRIHQDDLSDIGLLSSNSTGIPIYAASAQKIFSVHPNQPFHFSTSFLLEINATGNTNLDGYMITWREQV